MSESPRNSPLKTEDDSLDRTPSDLPTVVAHADWSVDADKRVVAVATLGADDQTYEAVGPEPVGDAGSLVSTLRGRTDQGSVLLGLDVPVGVPATWASRVGLDDFRAVLDGLDSDWASLADIAAHPDEIALRRPFYPGTSNGTSGSGDDEAIRRSHLTGGLGLNWDDLYRRCDRGSGGAPDGAPLFWTLGAKQVGKAALHAWQRVFGPARRSEVARVWPFDGDLWELLEAPAANGAVVLVEAYPATYHDRLGIDMSGSKRHQHHRRNSGPGLRSWARRADVDLGGELRFAIDDGFGQEPGGEDEFDAVVGLFGMIAVLRDGGPSVPDDEVIRRLEGWIFGRR